MALTLITGGARSGKSALAVRLAASWGGPVTVIATAEPRDHEMRDKIARHRADRPAEWTTVEEPLAIIEALAAVPGGELAVLDCITLWVSNALERGLGAGEVERRTVELALASAGRAAPVLIVTNEVGDGIVPADPGTRAWRNLMGIVNGIIAAEAERAYFVVAGRAIGLTNAKEVRL